jgi:Tfp pilus assembly protein PilX
MNRSAYSVGRLRQSGASLIVSLVVLGVLMLMGVAAMVISNTQYRLAGNLQFQNTALNNAEVALATAEQWLSAGTNFTAAGFDTYDVSTPMLYPGTYLADNNIDPLTMTWSDTNSAKADASGNQRYLIEQLAKSRKLTGSGLGVGGRRSTSCNEVNVYRITTRGVSGRGATRFVQAIFSVLSCPV